MNVGTLRIGDDKVTQHHYVVVDTLTDLLLVTACL